METVKRGNYSRDEIIQRNTVLQFCLESAIFCWNSMNYFYEDADGSIQLFMEEPFHQNMEEIGRTRMISNHAATGEAMKVSEAALAYQTNASKNIIALYYVPAMHHIRFFK